MREGVWEGRRGERKKGKLQKRGSESGRVEQGSVAEERRKGRRTR